jgi:hypothetical protein
MRRFVLATALLLPPAALACDPAEMEKAMTEICTAAADAAGEAVRSAMPVAEAGQAAEMERRLAATLRQCAEGDPALAAAEAVRLATFAARLEARASRS